jgi:hypothetical protein
MRGGGGSRSWALKSTSPDAPTPFGAPLFLLSSLLCPVPLCIVLGVTDLGSPSPTPPPLYLGPQDLGLPLSLPLLMAHCLANSSSQEMLVV